MAECHGLVAVQPTSFNVAHLIVQINRFVKNERQFAQGNNPLPISRLFDTTLHLWKPLFAWQCSTVAFESSWETWQRDL
jgi:hypothetical protein